MNLGDLGEGADVDGNSGYYDPYPYRRGYYEGYKGTKWGRR